MADATGVRERREYFGEFLVRTGRINDGLLLVALNTQRSATTPFGRLAIEMGRLRASEVVWLLSDAARTPARIGERAVARGWMSPQDVHEVLCEQRWRRPRLGDLLVTMEVLSRDEVERAHAEFGSHPTAELGSGPREAPSWLSPSVEDLEEQVFSSASPEAPPTGAPRALFLGGGYGAGKSYLRRHLLHGDLATTLDIGARAYLTEAVVDPRQYCPIVLDHILGRLPRFWEGICAGVPCDDEAYRTAQTVARNVLLRCIEARRSFLYEASLSRRDEWMPLFERLVRVGFEVVIVGVAVDKHLALHRVVQRAHREGRDITPARVVASHVGFLGSLELYSHALGSDGRLVLLDASEPGWYHALVQRSVAPRASLERIDGARFDAIGRSFGRAFESRSELREAP